MLVFLLEPLNKTILILFIIYCAGGVAAFFRSWLYTLAGQRLVARVRSEVSILFFSVPTLTIPPGPPRAQQIILAQMPTDRTKFWRALCRGWALRKGTFSVTL